MTRTPVPEERAGALAEAIPSIWNPQFILALIIGLAFGMAFNGFIPVLPLYLNALGSSPSEVGAVVGAYGLAALVLRPLTGRLTDQFGAKTMTLAGTLLFAVPTALMGLTSSTPLLVVLRVLQSAGLVSFFTAGTTLGIASVHPRRTGQALGINGLTGSIGGLIASPFAVQIANYLGWVATFAVIAGLAGLAAALCSRIRIPKPPAAPAGQRKLPLVNRKAMGPALIFLGFTLTQGPMLAFVPLLAAERGLGNPGIVLSAIGLGNMIMRPAAGWIADTYGRPVIVLPGMLLAALAMVLVSFAENQPIFWLTGVMYGMANGLVFTGMLALTLDLVPPEQRGSGIATFQWSWDIGSSVSAAVLGLLVATLGYGGVFALAGVFPVLGAAAFIFAMLRYGMGRRVVAA